MEQTTLHHDLTSLEAAREPAEKKGLNLSKVNNLELAKTRPDVLFEHGQGKHWLLMGFTLTEFNSLHSTAQFDFEKLEDEFLKVCPDYKANITAGGSYFCIQFCSLMIFTIGPSSRSVKKGDRETYWSMSIPSVDGTELRTINVATYKTKPPKVLQPIYEKGHICLTVKQGSLLALNILSQVVKLNIENSCLLTPLAGSIFCRDDIPKIAKCLNMDESAVTNMLNKSAQSGGFYLSGSDCAAAVVCALVATRNADEKVANSIVNKTVKQYIGKKKEFKDEIFNCLADYATGGVPVHLTKAKLAARLQERQSLRAQLLAQRELKDTVVEQGADGKPVTHTKAGTSGASKN